ncbi:hypothetical protein [Helicobacter vulpis]|uniref:hypothetical protein n=1 Tax=Helicobacter vulpis TaxID=2316076 RepID=UPI000EB3E3ED|nr:hypothetical protein [Helicobacter vulpis]
MAGGNPEDRIYDLLWRGRAICMASSILYWQNTGDLSGSSRYSFVFFTFESSWENSLVFFGAMVLGVLMGDIFFNVTGYNEVSWRFQPSLGVALLCLFGIFLHLIVTQLGYPSPVWFECLVLIILPKALDVLKIRCFKGWF